ncbi:MAG: hypothetical protein K1X75_06600 [Leptospirales bacterium]|nr:hypothetical protein [Leptospirales bacterium]
MRAARWQESSLVPERTRACPAPVSRLLGAGLRLPELEEGQRFARDFGLIVSHRDAAALSLRGAAPSDPALHVEQGPPSLLRLAFLAARERDLENLARKRSGERRSGGLFGKPALEFVDPEGRLIEVCAHPNHVESLELAPRLPRNTVREHDRRNEPIRLRPQPTHIYRLHSVELGVGDIVGVSRWYQDTLGLCASEFLFLPEEDQEPAAVFLRPNSGRKAVDHHCLALYKSARPGLISLNFECEHLDDLAMGGEYLIERGWRRIWGPVRRRAGSALYDCFAGPGDMPFAHVCDGDRVNGRFPASYSSLAAGDAFQLWGPRPPEHFFSGGVSALGLLFRSWNPEEPWRWRSLRLLQRALETAAAPPQPPTGSGA